MALTDLSRCSAAARHRKEPMAGSAPVASRWLLIEHQGPWARQPLQTPPMAGRVGERIESTCSSFGGRALLIRRQGQRRAEPGDPAWYAVDTVRGTWVRGTWRTAEDLLRAATALGVELSQSDEDAEPMVLVCTQGTRDACCAVRGRPIVAGLVRHHPEEVWECTHLGGHRFSGTLLSLPDGACYGRLDGEFAAGLVGAHLQGRASGSYLRGVTRWEAEVQAAIVAVLTEYGPAGVKDAVPGRVEAGEGPGRTHVEIFGSGPVPDRVQVEVTAEVLPDAVLSCAGAPTPSTAYHATIVSTGA